MTTHTPPPHLLDAIIDGSVTTLVQRCEPQPYLEEDRHTGRMNWNFDYPFPRPPGVCSSGTYWDSQDVPGDHSGIYKFSPFPAPGNPLTILDSNGDAVAEVVVVERGCKQVFVGCNDHEPDESGTQWYFTVTVRKDGSYE